MKFRAVMIDSVPMREFTNIVTTISKLSKECVMRLTQDRIYFIISEDSGGPSAPILWCDLPQSAFFSEYHMEGVDDNHKDIYLGFTSGNFAKSLVKLKQNAKSFKLKLTKKQCPCLTLEIEVPVSSTMETTKLTHDVPAVVIPRKDWSEYNEPNVPKYDVSIALPTLKLLRMTIDRMKTMSPHLMLKVNPQGKLIVQIKTDLVRVSSRFQGLCVEQFRDGVVFEGDETTIENKEREMYVMCRVDVKKFAMFLNSDQIAHTRALCSIVHKKLVNLCIETEENVKFQCFMPAIRI